MFVETDNGCINIKLIFREKKWSLCGPPTVLSEAVLLNFSLNQKELLEMRKQGKPTE